MFDRKGHLTEQAITALIRQTELDPLTRLEIAEHLAYCDVCLQRYTQALTEEALLAPPQSCRDTIWWRIRERSIRILTSRYATAAAAVALALTMVWADVPLPEHPPERPTVMEKVNDLMTGVNEFFDGLEVPGMGGKR